MSSQAVGGAVGWNQYVLLFLAIELLEQMEI